MTHCTLFYNSGTTVRGLRQILTGFFELQRHGIVKLDLVRRNWISNRSTESTWNSERSTSYLLKVIVNHKASVIYDVSDGIELEFIKAVVIPNCDILFKRSYTRGLAAAL